MASFSNTHVDDNLRTGISLSIEEVIRSPLKETRVAIRNLWEEIRVAMGKMVQALRSLHVANERRGQGDDNNIEEEGRRRPRDRRREPNSPLDALQSKKVKQASLSAMPRNNLEHTGASFERKTTLQAAQHIYESKDGHCHSIYVISDNACSNLPEDMNDKIFLHPDPHVEENESSNPTRQKEVQKLIDDFEDIFQNLPHGLPPDRRKERKYTGLPKCKMIEFILRMVSMKESMQHETQLISLMQSTPANTRSLTRRQRNREHPLQLPAATELSPSANGRKFDDSWFDDYKDPSLWLVCSSKPPHERNSCGLSCHLECALQYKKAGVVKIGQLMQLDGGYCCASCGRVSGLIGCCRKQLNIAKDAQRVDILCYHIYLSQRLLNGTCRFKELHDIVVKAARKIEDEVGPTNGVPSKMARGIVSRPSTGLKVQKLCTMAVKKVEVLLSRISPLGTGLHLTAEKSLPAACRMQFEDVTSISVVVLFKEIDSKIIARCSWLQIVAPQGKRIDLFRVSHLCSAKNSEKSSSFKSSALHRACFQYLFHLQIQGRCGLCTSCCSKLFRHEKENPSTALHISARRASIWFVCNLLIAGVSMDLCHGYMMRAIDMAYQHNHRVVANIIKNWDAIQRSRQQFAIQQPLFEIQEGLRPKDEQSENDVNNSPSGWQSNKN
eukprot:Gb_27301 [translate_table: standard]